LYKINEGNNNKDGAGNQNIVNVLMGGVASTVGHAVIKTGQVLNTAAHEFNKMLYAQETSMPEQVKTSGEINHYQDPNAVPQE
jgi:hypothetical protein